CYYLVDVGYTNCEGFLTPFRGKRYQLNEWRQVELEERLASNVIDDDEPNIIIMLGFSQSSVSSQNSRGTKTKWVPQEDATLVTCMVNLYNVETYYADTDSRTLKRDWTIVYDMLSGKDNSGFGWDEDRQMVVAEDVV
ncbi:hypothetical protein J1N35_043144, partial [Gossypium stocksii]